MDWRMIQFWNLLCLVMVWCGLLFLQYGLRFQRKRVNLYSALYEFSADRFFLITERRGRVCSKVKPKAIIRANIVKRSANT